MYSLVSLKLVFLPSFSWTHHNRSLINKRRSNAPEPSKSLNHEWIASHIAVSRREVTVWVETSHDCLPPFRKHPINKVILLLGLTTLLTNNRNVLPSSSWHRKNAPLRTFSYILLLIYKCLWVKTFVRVLGDSNLNLFVHLLYAVAREVNVEPRLVTTLCYSFMFILGWIISICWCCECSLISESSISSPSLRWNPQVSTIAKKC